LGIGQEGNGAGPQIWAVVNTPILNMLREAGFGAGFKLAISGMRVSFVGYSFINDTDLVQTGPTITSTGQEVLLLIQAALTYVSKASVQLEGPWSQRNHSGT